jgi:hypothetical protein
MRVQRGSRQLKSLKDRLAEFAAGVRKVTDELPPYARGDEALRKRRLSDIAAHIRGLGKFIGVADAEVMLVMPVSRQAYVPATWKICARMFG